jgi:hypothetical protein
MAVDGLRWLDAVEPETPSAASDLDSVVRRADAAVERADLFDAPSRTVAHDLGPRPRSSAVKDGSASSAGSRRSRRP